MAISIEEYLSQIEKDFATGQATELTYRPIIKALLEITQDIHVIHEPKHIACGAPDFVLRRASVPLGYVETKNINVDLEKLERGKKRRGTSSGKKRKAKSTDSTVQTFDFGTDSTAQNADSTAQNADSSKKCSAKALSSGPDTIPIPGKKRKPRSPSKKVKRYSLEEEIKRVHIEPQSTQSVNEKPTEQPAEQLSLSMDLNQAEQPIGDLNQEHDYEQIGRYMRSLSNWILTDYLEFRWYVQGERRQVVRIATPDMKTRLLIRHPDEIAKLESLLSNFIEVKSPHISTPQDLAERLARIAQTIRDMLISALQPENCETQATLHRQYHTFKDHLLPNLSSYDFADLYAQTITYGLFSAKLSAQEKNNFSRVTAYHYLAVNPFLRKLFLDVSYELNGTVIESFVDDLVTVLNSADMSAVLEDFGKKAKTSDTVIHFYETFLKNYDEKQHAQRGVYYTPEPVVQFMVRSVDWLLQTRFHCPLGLASKDVNVLDPATGTGTFLHTIVRSIHQTMSEHGQLGNWQDYVNQHLIPRIYGFELLMAPYVVAHLKMKLLLQELGYKFPKDKRLNIFLANTLDKRLMISEDAKSLGAYISDESEQAGKIKEELGIMVVMGNPPYNVSSMNPSKNAEGKLNFIGKLLQDYYLVNNQRIKEKNPKCLQDDYVKFIRFAQWRIQKTGYGIVAFVTNHGYLDNLTFGGMRQQLLGMFDEIFILNLHGNSRKKETAPDGSTDENIFDIQQGVSIFLGIKLKKHQVETQKESEPITFPTEYGIPQKLGQIFYAEIWGTREKKYQWLEEFPAENITWQTLQPTTPNFFFIPQDVSLRAEYDLGWPLNEMMKTHSAGITTARDDFVFAFDQPTLEKRVQTLLDKKISDETIHSTLGLQDRPDWQLSTAREELRKNPKWKEYVVPCLYRPFDIRWLFYHPCLVSRPRYQVMKHLIGLPNLCLIFTRQVSLNGGYTHVGVSQFSTELRCFYSSKGAVSIAPLYLYTPSSQKKKSLYASKKKVLNKNFSDSQSDSNTDSLYTAQQSNNSQSSNPDLSPNSDLSSQRCHNFSEKFVTTFADLLQLKFIPDGQGDLKTTFGPEDIFYYIYAVLHCPTYRSRYAEFLKLDFPRLPLTSDKKLFAKLVAQGHDLVELHLLCAPCLDLDLENWNTTYPISGDHTVESVKYVVATKQTSAGANTSGEPDVVGTGLTSGGTSQTSGTEKTSGGTSQTSGGADTSGGAVWINSTQYFGNIPQTVWEFQVGGYQVCKKWLDDRKGRQLTLEEIQHYQKMISAISQTLTNMSALEKLIPKFPLA